MIDRLDCRRELYFVACELPCRVHFGRHPDREQLAAEAAAAGWLIHPWYTLCPEHRGLVEKPAPTPRPRRVGKQMEMFG